MILTALATFPSFCFCVTGSARVSYCIVQVPVVLLCWAGKAVGGMW